MFLHFQRLFVCGNDRVHGGGAEAPLLQRPDALDGGAARGADRVLQRAGVLAAVQHHLGRSGEHLGCVGHGLVPWQTAGHGAGGQRLDK